MGEKTNNKNSYQSPIPITRPFFDKKEEQAVAEVLESGWVAQGPSAAEFEKQFARFTGAEHAVALSSGTAALHLALLAAGIGPGDEVIVPSFTFIATANAVEYAGARPRFVDIDQRTYNIDTAAVRQILTQSNAVERKVKAIIPVSLFGLCVDMDEINNLAAEFDLVVVEDAACALGAKRGDKHAGTEALAASFSFHPRKSITTGEGGMVITDDKAMADLIKELRNHGASASDYGRHQEEGGSLLPNFDRQGFNYRLTDIQAAIGIEQMKKADAIIADQKRAAAIYDEMLKDNANFITPFIPAGYFHAYQSYVCLYKFDPRKKADSEIDWDKIEIWNRERNRLMARMESQGISVRQGTHAVHTLGFYRNKYKLIDHDCPQSFIADRLSIALPLYYGITESQQRRVVDIMIGEVM
ncbi:MAG: DegT/DnrJ/EryC1/StrS aminotransferase family protein [FCB group bacterium]|nr:DegT/DnrJ/EryC1/StrS aminotransferase family protein [FCB group bacterium]